MIVSLDLNTKMRFNIPSSQKPSEGASHGSSRNVDSNTEQQLVTLVEAGDEECETTDQ
jgi:hypothetical protein